MLIEHLVCSWKHHRNIAKDSVVFVCLSELEDPEFAGYTDATRGVDFYFW